MRETKDIIELLERMITTWSGIMTRSPGAIDQKDFDMLTKIKGIVEQQGKTEIPLPVDRVGINEINTQPTPPDDSSKLDDLVERIAWTCDRVKTLDAEDLKFLKAEILKLLQESK